MPLSSDTRRHDRTPDDGPELTPLVTDEAREFLEGRISAEDYSEFVRHHAAREAVRDLAWHSVQRAAGAASTGRTIRLTVLLAMVGYGAVGAILSSNQSSGPALIATLSSGIVGGAAVMIIYETFIRRK
jgi:hypothetical protein